MIVVALIAILAAVVVPSFLREGRKAKSNSEANAMISEIAIKLDAYKSDQNNGKYTNAATLQNASPVTCPPSTTKDGVDALATCVTSGSAWADLRVQPQQAKLRCSYKIQVGDVGDALAEAITGVTFTPPTTIAWYLVTAECDGDNQGPPNTIYYRSSVSAELQSVNEGR